MVIRAVNQNNACWRALQRLGGCQATKTATDDYYNREMLRHNL
jgi:hypothetical protein